MTNPLRQRLTADLRYNAETGHFTRLVSNQGARAGSIAGAVGERGYIRIRVDGRLYYAHRLAWLYVHGEWPNEDIDHINCNPTDNRISNLRLCTRPQNGANRTANKNNALGIKGVKVVGKKFRAEISYGSKTTHLGYFSDAETAREAYRKAATELFGQFARI